MMLYSAWINSLYLFRYYGIVTLVSIFQVLTCTVIIRNMFFSCRSNNSHPAWHVSSDFFFSSIQMCTAPLPKSRAWLMTSPSRTSVSAMSLSRVIRNGCCIKGSALFVIWILWRCSVVSQVRSAPAWGTCSSCTVVWALEPQSGTFVPATRSSSKGSMRGETLWKNIYGSQSGQV